MWYVRPLPILRTIAVNRVDSLGRTDASIPVTSYTDSDVAGTRVQTLSSYDRDDTRVLTIAQLPGTIVPHPSAFGRCAVPFRY